MDRRAKMTMAIWPRKHFADSDLSRQATELRWVAFCIIAAALVILADGVPAAVGIESSTLPGRDFIAYFSDRGRYEVGFGALVIALVQAAYQNSRLPLIAGFFGAGAIMQSPGLLKCVAAAIGVILGD